jgi:ppGpp synthetase/RelA/SpoT-type nucleotidyltranferase
MYGNLKMFDAAEAQRKSTLRDWASYVDSVEDRIARAREALGDRYLLAPVNRVQRRVTPYGSVK